MKINFNSVAQNVQNNTTVSAKAQTSLQKELLFKPNENKSTNEIPENPPKNIEELKKFLADVLALDASSITEKTQLVKDLGLDELDYFILILRLEDVCEETFDENKVVKLKTVGDLMKMIEGKTQKPTNQ